MNSKSIKVPQPQFCNWVIKRRQELGLSRAELKEKFGSQISNRTLIYLESDKRGSFSEYTLTLLAKGLDIPYLDLLAKIDDLSKNKEPLIKLQKTKSKLFIYASIVLLLFMTFLLIANTIPNGILFSKVLINDARIHPNYPRVIVGFDKTGEKIWQRNLKTRVSKVECFDFENDGKKEIIASTLRSGPSEAGKFPGMIYIWNQQGALITEFNTWKKSIYEAKEPYSCVEDFEITDLENDGIIEIIVSVRGYQYHPSRVAIFHFEDETLHEIKTYWNPGYLFDLYIEDINNDNIKDIICTGVNNHFKQLPEFNLQNNVYSVFMLNGNDINGQAPPYFGEEQKGTEAWYYYVTPDAQDPFTKVTDVTFTKNNPEKIHIKLKNTCFFYLNSHGELIGKYKGDSCPGDSKLHLVSKKDRFDPED